jgi:hypothetical protein
MIPPLNKTTVGGMKMRCNKVKRGARRSNTAACGTAILALVAMALGAVILPAAAQGQDWPREIEARNAEIVLYQPQLETFEGDRLTCRAAVSVTQKGETEPVFGAIWLDARVATDRDTREVTLLEVKVADARFPNAGSGQLMKLRDIVDAEIPKWHPVISLDRLLAGLDLVEKERSADEGFKTSPPEIIFVNHPAVLILIDGMPKLSEVDDSDVLRVINSPMFILQDPSTKTHYLAGGEIWFAAGDIGGPWNKVDKLPKSVAPVAEKAAWAAASGESRKSDEAADQPKTDVVPEVIVRTGPAELIETDGEPDFAPIDGTDLLYVSNTSSEVFTDIDTGKYFILISGRWYTSGSMAGDWTYVPTDGLPKDFAKIPSDSDKGHILASVAGTQAAKDATMDARIPNTAADNID